MLFMVGQLMLLLIQCVRQSISASRNVKFPTVKYLKALLLQKSIKIDEMVMSLICQSVFTNLVSSFPDYKDSRLELMPSSVLFLLPKGAESRVDNYTLDGMIAQSVRTELYTEALKNVQKNRDGQLLEDVA
jgi:hypothetical protein